MTLLRNVVPPLITLALVLALWAYVTGPGGLPSYLLPDPVSVGRALWTGLASGEYGPHIQFTLTSTLLGYAIGSVAAVIAGVLVAESRTFERFVFVLSVLEGYSVSECATLLACTLRDVVSARAAVLKEMAAAQLPEFDVQQPPVAVWQSLFTSAQAS